LKIGFLQFNPIFGDVEYNVGKVVSMLKNVDFDLMVLPELFNTGYLFLDRNEVERLAEEIPYGYTCKKLMDLAHEKNAFIVAGIAEKCCGKLFNSAVIVGPKGVLGVYRKAHLFSREKLLFDKGDSNFEVYDIGSTRIGVLICFDWCFPEASRTLALKGADIICHPSNLVLPYAQIAMRVRAIENRVYTITANRVGVEERGGEKLKFTGLSQIVNPKMEVLCSAGVDDEVVGIVDVDPFMARDKWITPYNHVFNDRRVDLYRL
jgi:predicted amidohydrolase